MKIIARIFKKLLVLIGIILFLVIVLAVALYLSAGKLVQHFAPDIISHVTKTETTLGPVDLSLLSGRISLDNLAIGNPAGFKDKNALELERILVTFDPKTVLSDKIVINDVLIDGVHVSTELNAQGKTNISELLNNVNDFDGTDNNQPTQNKPVQTVNKSDNSNTKAVVVRDLKVANSSVRTGIAGQMMTIPLPEIHQQNIGEQKKQSIPEIVIGLLNTINIESTKAVLQATKEALSKNLQTGKDTVNSIKDAFKNLF